MRAAALLLTTTLALPSAARAADPKVLEIAGRTEANATVQVRARVAGVVMQYYVREGEAVKKGDVIAEIDDRVFRIEMDVARAKVALAEARARLADAEFARAEKASVTGAVSRDELTRAKAGQEEAKAGVMLAQADVARAELHLSWTRLTSPIDGRVSRLHLDVGNLVTSDRPESSVLTTVVNADVIRVAFDVDEKHIVLVHRTAGEKDKNRAAVAVGFATEDGYSHKAELLFVEPAVDPKTATLRCVAVMPNPNGRILPGQYVRVRLTLQDAK